MSSPAAPIPFANTYARLPQRFYARVDPTPVAAPRLIQLNTALAAALGIDPEALATPEGVAILAGNRIAAGSEPLAIAYAGHQFGHFVPALGDGRANLLGEVLARDIQRYDIQLKGSGPTPFSRRGDGRAALGPVLREYLVSEAMHALGVPTTRALAAVTTGQTVVRDTVQPGAIFTRVAASHIRVGTFQYFAARGDTDGVRTLADYAIARHYSQTAGPDAAHAATPYRALLDAVVARQAALIAQWLCLGFIHGVMNTDNMAISGETIDYGPCAFMEAYDPDQVFSSIDVNGRYAYANQPRIALWNLTRLAECLLPLISEQQDQAIAEAQSALGDFSEKFDTAYQAGLRRKLGLFTARDEDAALAQDLLVAMSNNHADFTLTFRRLSDAAADPAADSEVRQLFEDPAAYDDWASRWRQRTGEEPQDPADRRIAMRAANPAFIARNHLVEAVIEAAVNRDDFAPFEELLAVLAEPYRDQPAFSGYADPPQPHQRVLQTFCGT